MKEREALKLALEALEWINRINAMDFEYKRKARESLNAIYEALAEQPAQPEPVAHVVIVGDMVSVSTGSNGLKELHKLGDGAPLYTTPPQRKPLTDEEIILIVADCASSHQHTDIHFARAIEAAHGIKE